MIYREPSGDENTNLRANANLISVDGDHFLILDFFVLSVVPFQFLSPRDSDIEKVKTFTAGASVCMVLKLRAERFFFYIAN